MPSCIVNVIESSPLGGVLQLPEDPIQAEFAVGGIGVSVESGTGEFVGVGIGVATVPQAIRITAVSRTTNLTFFMISSSEFRFAKGGLTVCVTRAGAGGGTPSDWGNVEA